jgi:uncharacterized membrane protein
VGPGRFPFTRDNYSASALFNYAVTVWRQNWGRLVLSTLAFLVSVYAPAVVLDRLVNTPDDPMQWSEISRRELLFLGVSQVLLVIQDTAATLVLSGYALDLLQGRSGGLGLRLARLRALPSQLLALLLVYAGGALLIGVGYAVFQLSGGLDELPRSALITGLLALFAVPVLGYLLLGLVFLTFELALTPKLSPIAALQSSWKLVDSKRASVALVVTASTFLTVLGLTGCLVGVLFTLPLGMLWSGALFLALKQRG